MAADIREPFAHTSASLLPVRTADASPLYLSGRTQLTIFVRCCLSLPLLVAWPSSFTRVFAVFWRRSSYSGAVQQLLFVPFGQHRGFLLRMCGDRVNNATDMTCRQQLFFFCHRNRHSSIAFHSSLADEKTLRHRRIRLVPCAILALFSPLPRSCVISSRLWVSSSSLTFRIFKPRVCLRRLNRVRHRYVSTSGETSNFGPLDNSIALCLFEVRFK